MTLGRHSLKALFTGLVEKTNSEREQSLFILTRIFHEGGNENIYLTCISMSCI